MLKLKNLNKEDLYIRPATRDESKDFILHKHYAQRMPNIKFAFALIMFNEVVGILTIGKPASPHLCTGIMGKEQSSKVYELNRLVVNDGLPKNINSFFVGAVLRELKTEDLILVSYADEGMGHCGYTYQSTNWVYTGKTKGRTDKYVPDGKHSRHYTSEYDYLRKVRTAKHRYVFFTQKKMRKFYMKNMNYAQMPYPKDENSYYVLGEKIKDEVLNTNTGESFYE